MQGTAYYNGEQVDILEIVYDKVLIIVSNNPIETALVKVSDLDRITWYISGQVA